VAFWFEEQEHQAGIKSYLGLILVVLLIAGSFYFFQAANGDQQIKSDKKDPKQQAEDGTTEPVNTRQLSKEEAVTEVVKEVGPAVVKIKTAQKNRKFNIFAWETEQKVSGQGSGVIIDQAGYIVTNNHVIDGVDQIEVQLNEQGQKYEAEVVGTDPVTDLAVIKIEAPQKDLPVVDFVDSEQLKVGQLAIAIGNPYGFSNTVTTGVISALERKLPLQEETELANMIQTDAAINPGNSGGALLNSQGQVMGINTAIIEQGRGIGFAIPSNTVKEITQELIAKGKVVRPWIGIYGAEITPRVEKEYDLAVDQGVYVFRVIPDSPAAESGLQQGDIIVQLTDETITNMNQLKSILRSYQVGDTVEITVYRKDKQREIELELGRLPD